MSSGGVVPERTADAIVIGSLLAADVAAESFVRAGGHANAPAFGALPVIAAAVCAGVFWWRRPCPAAVLAAAVLLTGTAHGAVKPGLFTQHTGVPIVVAAYAVGSWATHRVRGAVVTGAVLVLVFASAASHGKVANAAALSLVLLALPWVAGHAARSRRLYTDEVERRLAEAERDRDLRAEQAILEERRVIARELHDVVAHHVGLIGVQAGAARTALDRSPETTDERLRAIEESSRSAVHEMGRLLGVLRSEGGAGELYPQPGLAALHPLVDGFRAAGLDVVVTTEGRREALSPVVDLCCYRVIEEALSNVARHSSAARADVTLLRHGGAVRVTVHDDGPPRAGAADARGSAGTGRGLVGMRERAALCNGEVHAGPDGSGGFTVDAVLREPRERYAGR